MFIVYDSDPTWDDSHDFPRVVVELFPPYHWWGRWGWEVHVIGPGDVIFTHYYTRDGGARTFRKAVRAAVAEGDKLWEDLVLGKEKHTPVTEV